MYGLLLPLLLPLLGVILRGKVDPGSPGSLGFILGGKVETEWLGSKRTCRVVGDEVTGVELGVLLGCSVGCAVGVGFGFSVGDLVDVTGIELGVLLGCSVGCAVGCPVVCVVVGFSVGDLVDVLIDTVVASKPAPLSTLFVVQSTPQLQGCMY